MRKVERPERNQSKRGKLSEEQEERKGMRERERKRERQLKSQEAVEKVKRQLKKSRGN